MRGTALGLAAVLLLAAGPAAAEDVPTIAVERVIRKIEFQGNGTTREHVMRREMIVSEGDVADPERIERSRQGIQDLGLFKAVTIDQSPVEGGVKLTVTVVEKWYILPVPRADANADGQKSFGLSLRWYNVGGYNQTLRGGWVKSDEARANQGTSTSYKLGYDIPFLANTDYSLSLGAEHSSVPVSDFGGYVENQDRTEVAVSRTFATGPRSQGWTGTVSGAWARQSTEGENAPEPYGQTFSPGIGASYRNVRDYLYSNQGLAFGMSLSGTSPQLGSDYSYTALSGDLARYFRVGKTPHQNFNIAGAFGIYEGGPDQFRATAGNFSLGGSRRLHGYESNGVEGDCFVYAGAEYLRPLFVNWLRGVVSLETGAVGDGLTDIGKPYGSAGLGLRVKVTFLVDMEVDLGVAVPVGEGGDVRIYGSKL